MNDSRNGVLAALGAFLIWGSFGLYFKSLGTLPPLEVLAHRILGGAVFALLVLMATGALGQVRAVAGQRRAVLGLAGSALAVAVNWGGFIWAVTHDRALEASMGYFIFPLVTVLMGRIILGEQLSRRQGMAVALAGLGVAYMAANGPGIPWMALMLATSFSLYGLLRKVIVVPALAGLFVETAFLAPLAALYLLWVQGGMALDAPIPTQILVLLAGPVTAIPLALFAFAARRLRLSTLGVMMYLNPSVQMLVAVFLFDEPFTPAHMITFGCIWCGLALYSCPRRIA